jgi:phospholipid-translocating ATPase
MTSERSEYVVYLNDREENSKSKYPNNYVQTTKYSLLTFIPKCIFYQFMRLANIYFLLTAIVQSIPQISPLNPFTAIGPLLLVLVISMVKEALEDMVISIQKRRKNDKVVNTSKTLIWKESHWQEIEWKDLSIGDVVKVNDGQDFPADLLVLTTSEQNGSCKLQTANLDGERNLKTKQALTSTIGLFENDTPHTVSSKIRTVINGPDYKLSSFEGRIEIDDASYYIDSKQLLLRGSNLRNTDYIIGMVVYAGLFTKIMMNIRHTPFKRSRYEKILNTIVVFELIFQTALCLVLAVQAAVFYDENEDAEYMFFNEDSEPAVVGLMVYATFFLLLNTLIPISLIVSLELVKFAKSFFFEWDLKMYGEELDQTAKVQTLNIQEELGLVDYIFCDKTGTLTSNTMEFKGCAVAGTIYFDMEKEETTKEGYVTKKQNAIVQDLEERRNFIHTEIFSESKIDKESEGKFTYTFDANSPKNHPSQDLSPSKSGSKFSGNQTPIYNSDLDLSSIHVPELSTSRLIEYNIGRISRKVSIPSTPRGRRVSKGSERTRRGSNIEWNYDTKSIERDILLRKDSDPRIHIKQHAVSITNQSEYLEEFLLALVLCNDVVTEIDRETSEVRYLGSSPDEVTLVHAAKEMGYIFLERTAESIIINIRGETKEFVVLNMLEFSSERKRMSVIVRHPDDLSIRMYIKGADNVIVDRLDFSAEIPYLANSKYAINLFAIKGLRTLVVAFKAIDPEQYEEWNKRYQHVRLYTTQDKENKIAVLAEEMEQSFKLIGVTAVEDKLQDKVPRAIEEFRKAGIKVWMLTGDKMETAENIGLSCKMITESSYIIKIKELNIIDLDKKLNEVLEEIAKIKQERVYDISLVIEGDALSIALTQPKELYMICQACNIVICCRANPKQKAQVVDFIQKCEPKAVTLAIGDGGNDVTMIQAAHIGVGLYGKEGYQAASSSDFAISEFKHLRYLLFYHGRHASLGMAFFISFFFFKNLLFTMPQFYFSFFSGFSGQTVWDDWYLLLYNSAITAAGVFLYVLFEQDLNTKSAKHLRKYWPALYLENKLNDPLTFKKFLVWVILSGYFSIIIFGTSILSYWDGIMNKDGMTEGLWGMSVCMYTSVVCVVNFTLIIFLRHWTFMHHLAVWGLSFLLYCPLFMFIYDTIPGTWVHGKVFDYLSTSCFWLTLLIATAVCVMPVYIIVTWKRLFKQSLVDVLISGKEPLEVVQPKFESALPSHSTAATNNRSSKKF